MPQSTAPYHELFSQASEGIDFVLDLLPQGEDAPIVGEGDPNAFYFVPSRTGTGVYVLDSVSAFAGCYGALVTPHLGTPAGVFVDVKKEQNADNTWKITISCFDHSGAALELDNADGDDLNVHVRFRNTQVSP